MNEQYSYTIKQNNGIRTETCIKDTKDTDFTPQLHQQAVKNYFINSPYRGLLLYHLLGSGKTCTSIIIADEMLKMRFLDPKKKLGVGHVYVCTPGSLRENFLTEYCKLCGNKKYLKKYYTFITYNANISEEVKNIDFNDSLVIIDEFHNLIRGSCHLSKNPYTLYNKILNSNSRNLILSATVLDKNIYEWSLIGNLLKDNVFPNIISKGEKCDNELFEKFKDQFFNFENLKGVISYFEGNEKDMPEVIYKPPIEVLMTYNQTKLWKKVTEYESNTRKRGPPKKSLFITNPDEYNRLMKIYIMSNKYILSRKVSNVFYSDSKFLLALIEQNIGLLTFKDIEKQFKENHNVCSICLKNFQDIDTVQILPCDHFFHRACIKDWILANKTCPLCNIVIMKQEDEGNIIPDNLTTSKIKGWISHKILNTDRILTRISPKIVSLLLNILKNFNSKHVIFSFFLNKSGLKLIHNLFKLCGIKSIIYSGSVSSFDRQIILNKFNSIDNRYGKNIKVLLLTDAGVEGISLLEVENVHFLESNINANKTLQAIGRAVRYNSHKYMPDDKKHVNIWKYFSIPLYFNEKSYNIKDDIKFINTSKNLNSFEEYYEYYVKGGCIKNIKKNYGDIITIFDKDHGSLLEYGVDKYLNYRLNIQIDNQEEFYTLLQENSIEKTGLINNVNLLNNIKPLTSIISI